MALPKLSRNRVLSWMEAFELEGRPWSEWIKGNRDIVKRTCAKS